MADDQLSTDVLIVTSKSPCGKATKSDRLLAPLKNGLLVRLSPHQPLESKTRKALPLYFADVLWSSMRMRIDSESIVIAIAEVTFDQRSPVNSSDQNGKSLPVQADASALDTVTGPVTLGFSLTDDTLIEPVSTNFDAEGPSGSTRKMA